MKKILFFSVKVIISLSLACIFAVIATEISRYHFAGVSGFIFGGIFSYAVIESINLKKI